MKIPSSRKRSIPPSLQDTLDVGDVPKRFGMKWEGKDTDDQVSKKVKSQRKSNSKNSKPSVIDEDSEERTQSDICVEDIQNKEDTTNTSWLQPNVLKPIATFEIGKISTPPSSSQVIPTGATTPT
ncbi:unnamed protein product [Lactuca virosa]|uniref:Uncharacterized protein n=1 Tax=Lactuca virosa TaxID=75947 RepID=A0AAU9N7A8_9ASTR|nr:unnamed protein product [Lactuca virosa]